MIRTPHRTKGASALGARQAGEQGPFGTRPDLDEDDRDGQEKTVMTYRAEGGSS